MRSLVWSNVDYPVLARHGQAATWVSDPACELYAYSWKFGMTGCVHPGVDIKMPHGTPVYAIRSGTVERIRNRDISGRMEVVIRDALDHEHLYTHLSSRAVDLGERVTQGQRVGASGTLATPHLHFEHRIPDASTGSKWRIISPVPLLTTDQETPTVSLPTHPYRPLIEQVCAEIGTVPPNVLEAMVWTESEFNPAARSPSDALGLCQIIYRWHGSLTDRTALRLGKQPGHLVLFDPDVNLRVGATHLRWCYSECGTWEGAVRKYHSGTCNPSPGFEDGAGTSSNEHITRYRTHLHAVEAARTEQETPVTYTPKVSDWWLHLDRTVNGTFYPGVKRYIENRGGNKPQKIVVHVQEGGNFGSWQWFHQVNASSTVLIGKNGDIWRLVPEQHGPWTNGDVKSPVTVVRDLLAQYGADPNAWTLTIENEGFTGNLPYTDAQFESNVWQCVQWCTKYGLNENDILRHGQINSVDRPYCPEGSPYPFVTKLKARVGAELGGTIPDPPAPAPAYAEPVTIPGLAELAAFARKVGLAITAVNYQVKAIRQTPRYQSPAGKLIGPDIQAGQVFPIMAEYTDAKGKRWLITPHWTRVRADDVERVAV